MKRFSSKIFRYGFFNKKRVLLERQYSKMKYVLKSLKNILKMINLNLDKLKEFNNIKKLYVGMPDKYNEGTFIFPFNEKSSCLFRKMVSFDINSW